MLNRIPAPETEDRLRRALIAEGIDPVAVLADDPSLRRAWLEGTPLNSPGAQAEALKLAGALGETRWPASEEQRSQPPQALHSTIVY